MRNRGTQPSYRGERRESSVPLFRDWKQWRGEIEPGHFWCQDLHVARAELLGQGHQPHVAMRGLVEWRYLRLRAKGGDCVVHEYPEDAEVLGKWMAKLDFGYRGQRLAAAASEVFASLLKARRDRGDLRELLLEQQGLCALCGTPIDAATRLKESQLLHDLAGGCVHELTENRRSDERIFRFLQYLRVDEAEQVPLRDAVQVAREQFPMRGLPDTCLVISHAHRMAINDRENAAARSGGGGAAGAPRAGSRRDQPAADHAPVAGAQARGGGREGAQGVLRHGAGGGRADRAGRRAVLHGPPSSCAARASATPSPTPRARG